MPSAADGKLQVRRVRGGQTMSLLWGRASVLPWVQGVGGDRDRLWRGGRGGPDTGTGLEALSQYLTHSHPQC